MFNAFYLFPKVIRKDILSTPMKQPNYLQKKKQDDPTIYSECLSLSLNDEDKLCVGWEELRSRGPARKLINYIFIKKTE